MNRIITTSFCRKHKSKNEFYEFLFVILPPDKYWCRTRSSLRSSVKVAKHILLEEMIISLAACGHLKPGLALLAVRRWWYLPCCNYPDQGLKIIYCAGVRDTKCLRILVWFCVVNFPENYDENIKIKSGFKRHFKINNLSYFSLFFLSIKEIPYKWHICLFKI